MSNINTKKCLYSDPLYFFILCPEPGQSGLEKVVFLFELESFFYFKIEIYTVKENECHTARFPVRRFDCFDHLYKGILKQMIPHLKALIFSY